MQIMEKFAAWVAGLPSGIRWVFSFVLALVIIGAGIASAAGFANRVPKPAKQAGVDSGATDELERHRADHAVSRSVGSMDAVFGQADGMEQDLQNLESESVDLVAGSKDLINEARRRAASRTVKPAD